MFICYVLTDGPTLIIEMLHFVKKKKKKKIFSVKIIYLEFCAEIIQNCIFLLIKLHPYHLLIAKLLFNASV